MNPSPETADAPLVRKDAIFLSPHKFIGGPGTPGVLVVKRALLKNRVPTTATNLTHWIQINANNAAEERVEYDGTSPIDGKRFFRFRWRFRVKKDWPIADSPLPQILNTTIEFER